MSEWIDCELQGVADVRVSNVDKKIYPGQKPVRLCNYMDVYSNEYITANLDFMPSSASDMEIEKFRVLAGDVIITKDSETPFDIGIAAAVKDEIPDLVCGYHLALLRPKAGKIDSVLLSKLLGSEGVKSYFSSVAAGSTRFGLSFGSIQRVPLRLPKNPDQQKKIVAILETVDEAIEQTEALIGKYEQVKAGMMQDLFTRGLTPGGKLRPPRDQAPDLYQQIPIGWIPKDWEYGECREYCERICVGIVIRPAEHYVAEGVATLRSANVHENEIYDENLVFISHTSNLLLRKSQIQAGDILTVRTGYPGTSAVVPTKYDGCNCVDILISTPKADVDPAFLCYWINSAFGKWQVLRKQGGLAQQHFNVGEMRELLIVQPSDGEQFAIVERLDALKSRLDLEQDILQKLRQQKSGLMQDLLTGKVPVKV